MKITQLNTKPIENLEITQKKIADFIDFIVNIAGYKNQKNFVNGS